MEISVSQWERVSSTRVPPGAANRIELPRHKEPRKKTSQISIINTFCRNITTIAIIIVLTSYFRCFRWFVCTVDYSDSSIYFLKPRRR